MAEWPSRSPSRASRSAALTLAGAAFAAAAYAVVPPLVPPEQVAGAAGDVAVDQLGGQGNALVSAPPLPAIALPPDQLSPSTGNPDVIQLHRPEKEAAAVPAISAPGESRPQAAEPIGGKDRCDPQARTDGKPRVCSNPVESRAAEFARPSIEVPVQSAEKRLLAGRIAPEAATVARDASRGETGDYSTIEDSSTQAIASIVLAPPPSTPPDKKPGDEAADPAAIPADPASLGILLPPPGQP